MSFRAIKNYFSIPYVRTLLITLNNGKQIYCERIAHTSFEGNKQWTKNWNDLKGRGGKYKIREGIWNLFPDDGPAFIPYKDIKAWKFLKTKEDFEEYEKYRLNYYKEHPVELYLPENRDEITKKFLNWVNLPHVQEGIRNWVSGYGYSDAYNWESPDILMEHIFKAGYTAGQNNKKVKSKKGN